MTAGVTRESSPTQLPPASSPRPVTTRPMWRWVQPPTALGLTGRPWHGMTCLYFIPLPSWPELLRPGVRLGSVGSAACQGVMGSRPWGGGISRQILSWRVVPAEQPGELQHFLCCKPLAKSPFPHSGPVTGCFETWPLPGAVLRAIPGDKWVRRGLMGCGEGP